MRQLVLLRGVMGAGKSTFIKEKGLEQYTLSADDIRLLFQSPVMSDSGGETISQKNDGKVWKFLLEVLEERMKRGEFTIIDATHAKTEAINRYKKLAQKYRYRVFVLDFSDVSLETALKRNKFRSEYKFVPEISIMNAYERMSTEKIPNWVTVVKPEEFDDTFQFKPKDYSEWKKIHIIGDIHGCYDALMEYIGEIKEDELYIFCGDYLDRGIQNKEVLDFMLDIYELPNVILLEGNHECFHKDTEVLTKEGWKKIKEVDINKDLVYQYDINTKEIEFAKPVNKIEKKAKKLLSFESNNMKQVVTENHDILYNDKKIKASELKNACDILGTNLKQSNFPLSGLENHKVGIDIEDNLIRLITWIVMDGTIYKHETQDKHRIQFKLSKERKVRKITQLLDLLNIEYSISEAKKSELNKLQPYIIYIHGEYAKKIYNMIDGVKELPKKFANMNSEQLNIFLKTIEETDGYVHGNSLRITTISKNTCDIIQEVCIKNNIATTYNITRDGSGFENGSTQYRISIFHKGLQNNKVSISELEYDDFVYCLTMPKGTLVTRIDGKLAISGNCHLRNWAHDEQVQYKEFVKGTQVELEKDFYVNSILDKQALGEYKKEVRQFCRKLAQISYFTHNGAEIVVTHGGIAKKPDNFIFMSTEQLIRGVGDYNLDIDDVWEKNHSSKGESLHAEWTNYDQVYQIHGHRNIFRLPVHSSVNSFNLEGQVEMGGCLRAISITKDGISTHEVKNNVFVEPPITEENFEDNIENFLQSMNEHEYINAKDLGDNIYAFNFTRKAFENRNWDEINVKARGLFINVNTKEIVSRSYNKFFNVNEHYNTKIQRLADNLKFPVYAYDKPNGYLGTVGYNSEKDELVFTSKSDIHAEHATWLKELFYKTFNVEKREIIKKFIKDKNVSLVFEVIKVKEDPHIIKYYNDKLVLLDIVYRDIVYKKMNYELVKNFAIMINVEFKELEHVFYNWVDFYKWYRDVSKDWSLEKEGYVIEDSSGFMTKIKLPYYNFWKQMRGLKDVIVGKHEHTVKGSTLYTPLHNKVFSWLKKQDRDWLRETDIITIREEFYKQNPQ